MARRHVTQVAIFAIVGLLIASRAITARGQLPPVQSEPSEKQGNAATFDLSDIQNIPVPTLGGAQFWGDEHIHCDWRIQRNVLTGHCRLLDPKDRRRAAGTLASCHRSLKDAVRDQELQPPRGRVVVLLHGLGRTRGSMDSLRAYLANNPQWTVVSVGYPSTRANIQQHAELLHRIVQGMPQVTSFDFVGHSMGNIVVRRYLKLLAERKDGDQMLKRIGRIVMLCPPNQGAMAAEKLAPLQLSGVIGGPPIKELGSDWAKLDPTLATPRGAFGILAGGKSDQDGFNRLIPGDDDMVISVATTRLAGASDFRVIASAHTYFMDNETVQSYVQRFLQHGFFESAKTRQPVVDDADP